MPKHSRNMETITTPFALLVEGADDRAVVLQLIRRHELTTQADLGIFEYDGKTKLKGFLKGFRNTEGFNSKLRSIGVIRDADDDPPAAVTSVQTALVAAGFGAPTAELQKTVGRPSVSFLLLPGNAAPGCIEDVCLSAVGADPLLPDAHTFITTISAKTARPPAPRSKAVIHSFLATRTEPGLPLGKASEAGFIDLNHQAFHQLIQLVQLVIAP